MNNHKTKQIISDYVTIDNAIHQGLHRGAVAGWVVGGGSRGEGVKIL